MVEVLTHADSCDDGRRDDGQGHAPCDGEVPSVARCLLQLVVGVDLQHRDRHRDRETETVY